MNITVEELKGDYAERTGQSYVAKWGHFCAPGKTPEEAREKLVKEVESVLKHRIIEGREG